MLIGAQIIAKNRNSRWRPSAILNFPFITSFNKLILLENYTMMSSTLCFWTGQFLILDCTNWLDCTLRISSERSSYRPANIRRTVRLDLVLTHGVHNVRRACVKTVCIAEYIQYTHTHTHYTARCILLMTAITTRKHIVTRLKPGFHYKS